MNISKETEKFCDIYEIWHVPFWQKPLFWYLVYLFAVLWAGIILWRLIIIFNRRKKVETAWDRALRELNSLAIQDITTKEQGKRFYFLLTSIIKKYLQERYGISIDGKTDQELIPLIEQSGVPCEIGPSIRTIFTGCLRVKYANEMAMKEQLRRDLDSAILLVRQTSMIEKNNSAHI